MKVKYPVEIGCFVLLLVVFNFLKPADSFAFYLHPSALYSGEWWRWLSFSWKHNSIYHLAMDASAFIFLYQALRCRLAMRIQHLAFCILFSGLVPILVDPRLWDLGLCGLSGVAHGLMFICAFETAEQKTRSARAFACVLFVGVLGKTIFEQLTGNVLLAEHHLGNVGTPIASCHFGGLVGALVSYLLKQSAEKSVTTATHRKFGECRPLRTSAKKRSSESIRFLRRGGSEDLGASEPQARGVTSRRNLELVQCLQRSLRRYPIRY